MAADLIHIQQTVPQLYLRVSEETTPSKVKHVIQVRPLLLEFTKIFDLSIIYMDQHRVYPPIIESQTLAYDVCEQELGGFKNWTRPVRDSSSAKLMSGGFRDTF